MPQPFGFRQGNVVVRVAKAFRPATNQAQEKTGWKTCVPALDDCMLKDLGVHGRLFQVFEKRASPRRTMEFTVKIHNKRFHSSH